MALRRFRRDLLALALLCGMVVCVFWKLTLTGQFTFIESPDVGHQVLPWLQVQAAALRQGTITLWDPYLFGGQPLPGQVQPAMFSPFTWMLLAMPLTNGHLRIQFVHYWFVLVHCFAGLFAYLFFRDLGCSRAASVLAALFFATAGFVGNTAWPQIMAGDVWAPLIFLFLLRSFAGRKTFGSAALAGLFLGLSWLSGHHAVPMFLSLAVAGTWLARTIRNPRDWRRLTLLMSLLVICTALVSAVQVLPAVEYGHYALRWVNAAKPVDWSMKVPYTVHENFGLPPRDLLFAILPGEASGINPIMGVVAIWFAVLAVAVSANRRAVKLFSLLAVAGLLFAMARFDLLHGILYSLVPELEKARAPIMALSVVHFAVAVLVALGVDAFLANPGASFVARAPRWIACAGAALLVLAFLPFDMLRAVPYGPDRCAMIGLLSLLLAVVVRVWSRGQVSRAAVLACAAALLLVEIGNSTGFSYVHWEDKESLVRPRLAGGTSDLAAFLASQPGPFRVAYNYPDLLFNFGDWYGIDTMSGFVPVLASVHRLGWWNQRVLDLYGVRYWIGYKAARPDQREVFTSAWGWKIFESPGAFPRVWTVHDSIGANGPEEASQLVLSEKLDLRKTAVLAGSMLPLEHCSAADDARVFYHSPQNLTVEVQMGCAGLLVLADNWFPGWEAAVDGKPAPILVTDAALRGVVVPAGSHRVTMRYRPRSVLMGLGLTLLGLALSLFMAFRRESATSPPPR